MSNKKAILNYIALKNKTAKVGKQPTFTDLLQRVIRMQEEINDKCRLDTQPNNND